MNIQNVGCDQFAGIQRKNIEYDQGLNLIIGDNETGKSTLVDLIYFLLFKDVKLDGRTDVEFLDKYFPKKVQGPQGDVIDGVLEFETENGTYKIKKEWEKGAGTCRLVCPDGTSIKNIDQINSILTEELGYSAGVYDEIVFASQKRNQMAVKSIMCKLQKKADIDELGQTRDVLTSTLTQAALETGGVSLDKMEQMISLHMEQLSGQWDPKADAPKGGASRASYKNKWQKNVGEIAAAYYEMDEARAKQQECERLEEHVESGKLQIRQLRAKKEEVETKKEAFQKVMRVLEQKNLLCASLETAERDVQEQEKIYISWPKFEHNQEQAHLFKERLEQAVLRERFETLANKRVMYEEKKQELDSLNVVDAQDVTNYRTWSNEKQKEESKLAGMNLAAKIKQLGDTEITVKSIANDEVISGKDGSIAITEAVVVHIPGVMEMQLQPQGVDVETVKANIVKYDAKLHELQDKYGIKEFEDLQAMENQYRQVKTEAANLKNLFDTMLGDTSWETLQKQNGDIPVDVEPVEEVKRQVEQLCGRNTIDAYIGSVSAILDGYKQKYESKDALAENIRKLKLDITSKKEKLQTMAQIPEEYQNITDTDAYQTDLQGKSDVCESKIKVQEQDLRAAEIALGKYDKTAEEYHDAFTEKRLAWEAKKMEYEHWVHIHDTFLQMKESIGGNPVEDIEKNFRVYLDLISDGAVALDSIDDKMSVSLASGKHMLTYDILSEGTEETVSLAFRLAMLEHLFPEGNGLAVFDDPFVDMDAKRVKQSCRLIEKFAEKNQVIFTTCDAKYQDLMQGNVICL